MSDYKGYSKDIQSYGATFERILLEPRMVTIPLAAILGAIPSMVYFMGLKN